MGTCGILTVAYGADYDRCAAHAFLWGRKYTDLPIFIITNVTQRSPVWEKVGNVKFLYFPREQRDNRRPKLGMDLLTPFDKTLYIDADSVIQNPGVGIFEKLLDDHEMVFNWRITFQPGEKIWNIYARCMKQFGVTKPISICNGGIIAFRKGESTRILFNTWLKMWEEFGTGREMAPLNCAIKKTGIDYGSFPLLYFADAGRSDNSIIQHNYNGDFNKRFGIPPWKDYKPFDGDKTDFRFETIPT
jgi:hypothetical protein